MPEEHQEKSVERFLVELMEIQRRYATDRRGEKTNRREDVRELVDKHVAAESNDAD